MTLKIKFLFIISGFFILTIFMADAATVVHAKNATTAQNTFSDDSQHENPNNAAYTSQGPTDSGLLKKNKFQKIILIVFFIIFPLILVNSTLLKRQVNIKTAELVSKNKLLNEQLEEIVKTKKTMSKSELQFRSLFNNTTEGIAIFEFLYNADGRPEDYIIIDANKAYIKNIGIDRKNLIGKKSTEVFSVDRPPYFGSLVQTLQTRKPRKYETYIKHLGRHFSVQLFSLSKSQVVTVVNDITSRKQADDAIKASEEKYRLLVENAHDSIFVVQDNELKYVNPSTLTHLKWKGSEADKIMITDLIHPDDLEMVLNAHVKRLSGEDVPNNYTFRAVNYEGEHLWLQINAVQFDWEGRPAILCIVRNISDEKKLEDQLMQAQKMEAIGTLAGGIAHDFNNILSAIIGYTELCLQEVPENGKAVHRLNRVFEASQRARDLVNQILNFSKQKEKELKPIRIRLIIDEALKLLRATMPSTITFETNLSEETAIITGDATQLHQVIMNLCTNAFHAMQDTGGTLSINLENITIDDDSSKYLFNIDPGEFVRLQISDTGHGMDETTIKRIFDPYFTTKNTGKGTGLGLSVVHGIVQSMNGDIKIYSEPDKGTTFNIFFPVSETDSVSAEKSCEEIKTGTERILLVDDEEIIAEMTAEMLEILGYQVTTRVSAVEAIQVFANNPERFDLVITDQTMPQKTGRELAIDLLKIKPDIPIIICTGFSSTLNEKAARKIGIKAFLNKPVLKNNLAEAIRRVLDEEKTAPLA